MKCYAVIGANFGDEGKGLMVDYLASRCEGSVLVVKNNGGPQAGHTVTSGGQSFVFHHLGSASLRGADTMFGKNFFVNPFVLANEHMELANRYDLVPDIYIHPLCRVTTHYDIIANHIMAESYHGTCGMGIWQTLNRQEALGPVITGEHILNYRSCKDAVIEALAKIESYTKEVLIKADLEDELYEYDLKSMDEAFLRRMEVLEGMVSLPRMDVVHGMDNIIFECGQGLGLDSEDGTVPYVTPSRTGMAGINAFMEAVKPTETELVYVTRSYITRHGEGPLEGEDRALRYTDYTNKTNQFQGRLRFAPMTGENWQSMRDRIATDITYVPDELNYKLSLAITHMDQKYLPLRSLANIDTFDTIYTSTGPSANDVRVDSASSAKEEEKCPAPMPF